MPTKMKDESMDELDSDICQGILRRLSSALQGNERRKQAAVTLSKKGKSDLVI